jgi:hypothetical protein
MEKIDAVEKLIYLVKQIPDEKMDEVLQAFEDACDALGVVTVEPFDRSNARPEYLERLDSAREAARRGEVVTDEEAYEELFGS